MQGYTTSFSKGPDTADENSLGPEKQTVSSRPKKGEGPDLGPIVSRGPPVE